MNAKKPVTKDFNWENVLSFLICCVEFKKAKQKAQSVKSITNKER